MNYFVANDVAYSFKRAASNGTTIYSRDLDSYFATVDRLYAAGARRFLFNNVVPFDRALAGITQGPRLQAKLAVSEFFFAFRSHILFTKS
jgi:hypothetical protein